MKLATLIATATMVVCANASAQTVDTPIRHPEVINFCEHYARVLESTAGMRDKGLSFAEVIDRTVVTVNPNSDIERKLFAVATAATAELCTNPTLNAMKPHEVKIVSREYCLHANGNPD